MSMEEAYGLCLKCRSCPKLSMAIAVPDITKGWLSVRKKFRERGNRAKENRLLFPLFFLLLFLKKI